MLPAYTTVQMPNQALHNRYQPWGGLTTTMPVTASVPQQTNLQFSPWQQHGSHQTYFPQVQSVPIQPIRQLIQKPVVETVCLAAV